jgi:hypothetical protein
MQGLDFVYFCKGVNILLYVSTVLYLHLLDLWDVSVWTGILGLYFVWQTSCQIQIIDRKVNYFFNIVYQSWQTVL